MSNYQSVDLERLAAVFKALGNPHRLRILAELAACCHPGAACCGKRGEASTGELRVGEIGGGLQIVASTLSHHVKELSQAGLLSCNRQGKCVMCCADSATLRELGAFFTALAGDAPLPRALIRAAIPTTRRMS